MKKTFAFILSIFGFYFTSAQNPIANFQANQTSLCANDCINFTNLSTNSTSWQWYFAGAIDSTSTAQNPQNICYQTSGIYNVTLVAINGSKRDTLTLANYIKVNPSPPTPLIIQRNDTLYCSVDPSYTSYQWYYDTTLIPAATDTFLVVSQSGDYNVLVANANGCRIAVGITVIGTPVSNFSASDNPVCDHSCIAFNNLSSYAVSYKWYFPGGMPSSSTDADPQSVCYDSVGIFPVTLISINSYGSDTLTMNNYINVVTELATPVITLSNDTLYCTTSPAYTSYQWYFDRYPLSWATDTFLVVHNAGTYSLKVSNSGGCNNSAQITVKLPPVFASFISTDSNFCAFGCAGFIDLSSNANAWIWSFPGGYPSSSTDEDPAYICYSVPGTYNVTLIAIGDSSIDSLTLYNYIKVFPGIITPVITQSHDTLFCSNDSSYASYQWTLNDTLLPSPNDSFVVITDNGNYSVYVSNASGCEATASYYWTTVPATASFSVNDTAFCQSDCISFTNLSQNAGSYQWSFPGGLPSTSSDANPQNICYRYSGSYDVTLIAFNNVKNDTLALTNFIQVYPGPVTPLITQSNDTLFCSTDPSYNSYQWYDSTTLIAGATDTFLVVTQSGDYSVQVENWNGCSIVVGYYFNIVTSCSANFSIAADTSQLHHYIVTNNATGASPISYYWSWGDGTHDIIPYPTHTYADSGFYTICLSVTDANACISTFCDSSFHAMRTTNTMVSMTVVPGITGVQTISVQTEEITIYPNPVTNQLTIHSSAFHNEAVTVSIMNVLGKTVQEEKLKWSGDSNINIRNLSEGIYFLQVKSQGRSVVKKFVKE